jgi:23S rRNA pseudouridine2605 synthase
VAAPDRKKTLDRVLSQAGVASRAEARRWIGAGRVAVDGRVVRSPDAWVDPRRQRLTVDGKPLRVAPKVYLLLNKPKGYVTSARDARGRPTVFDLLPPDAPKVTYAGRLDLDTSGLLILTNDTAFAEFLTNPESHVPKTYLVKASPALSDDDLDRLRRGVELSDGTTRPAVVRRLRDGARHTFFEITITEGRNRQVRRMVEALGARVQKLVRTAVGGIQIAGLETGRFRALTAREVRRTGFPPQSC